MKRIISGGQTGVDRAALRFGLEYGYEIGGYCPADYLAEDGQIPEQFRPYLTCLGAEYPARTRSNVAAADATLVIRGAGPISRGTALTIATCNRLGKPHLVVRVDDPRAAATVREWITGRPGLQTLNVAGPRESKRPGIGQATYELLTCVFDDR